MSSACLAAGWPEVAPVAGGAGGVGVREMRGDPPQEGICEEGVRGGGSSSRWRALTSWWKASEERTPSAAPGQRAPQPQGGTNDRTHLTDAHPPVSDRMSFSVRSHEVRISGFGIAVYALCASGQVTYPLWAPVSTSVKEELNVGWPPKDFCEPSVCWGPRKHFLNVRCCYFPAIMS